MINKLFNSGKDYFSKYNISTRINLLTIITASIILCLVCTFYSFTIYKLLFSQKEAMLENVMDNAYSIVKSCDEQYVQGKMTKKEAQELAMGLLSKIRFLKEENKDPRGYYFIHDFSGTYVMHPIRSDLVGKNKINLTDKNGYKVIYNLAKIAKSDKGQGSITFYWDKPGIDKKFTFPKLGYVKGYKPWGWAIGTGDYIDDIEHQVIFILLMGLFPCILLTWFIIFLINNTIGQSIVNPIKELTKASQDLVANNLELKLKDDNSQTEMGELNRAFKKFAIYFKQKLEHELFITSILETTPNGIIIIKSDGEIISFNKTATNIFKEEQSKIIGQSVLNLIPTLPLSELIKNLSSGSCNLKTNLDNRFEVEINYENQQLFLDYTFSNLELDQKNVYMLVFRDITKQKEAKNVENKLISEQEILYRKLEQNMINQAAILNNIPFMVWLKDVEGKLLTINEAYAKMCGTTIEEIIGKTDFDFFPAEEAEIYVKEDNLVMTKKQPIGSEDVITGPNGKIWHETIKSPVFDDEGAVTGTVGMSRDITEKKKIEKMKDEFVSTVSHELRTPLTAIRGALGLVLTGSVGDVPDKVKSLINISNNNCLRLTNLINDILDLEKIKAGKYSFVYEELEINSILEQSITLNQSYADSFGMNIKFISNIGESYLKADKSRLIQVISNLISNAVKFSRLGGEVLVKTELASSNIKVSVIDNGIGIPEDSKYKIFQSFSQVDSSDTRAKGGTGLGLSISKLIIENMGGNIGFESELDKGSAFFFTMPVIEKGSLIYEDGETIQELNPEDF